MFRKTLIASGIALAFAPSAWAADSTEMEKIRSEIQQLKQSYETRIKDLEQRLQKAETKADRAEKTAAQAQTAAPARVNDGNRANAFNPDVSLILSGTYADLKQKPDSKKVTGFLPNGAEGFERGFSLGESELVMSANIDPYLSGRATIALTPENKVEVEEAYFQTTALSHGITARGGRFFSGMGYLNEQHPHQWDFVDAPLVYQTFFGGQYGNDGLQLKWVAPTDLFFEVGAEVGNGKNFPGADQKKNGIGAGTLFAHLGGDVGTDHSWRAGVSYLTTRPKDREFEFEDLTETDVKNQFSGRSRTWGADFVWKWAPGGNATQRNFKVQGEYFKRKENGGLTYDVNTASSGPATDAFHLAQSGWYLQGVYQFMPRWRVGLRHDRLDSGTIDLGTNASNLEFANYRPSRNTAMIDYSPSEFSRFRLQLARDKSQQGVTDNQIFLQYVLSLGAHGAHKF